MGVGMPATLLLEHYGAILRDAFDAVPYHVGSSLTKKTGWRDVDVRLILDDDEYERLFGPPSKPQALCARWSAMCLAFSALGRELTGLPIDFQVQQQTDANASFDGPRGAIGITLALSRSAPEA